MSLKKWLKMGLLDQGASTSAIVYALRDLFITDAAAPLTSPRTCEPGPGTLTIVDTNNIVSVSGGELVVSGNGTNGVNPGVWSDPIQRVSGACVIASWATSNYGGFGLSPNNTTAPLEAICSIYSDYGLMVRPGGTQYAWDGTKKSLGFILRSVGQFVVDVSAEKLLYVFSLDNTSPVYAYFTHLSAPRSYSVDWILAASLEYPWNNDYGIATQCLLGQRSGGDAFVHLPNCLIEFTVDAIPSSGNIDFRFRVQDAENYWQIVIDSTGAFTLNEVVNNVATQRATKAGVVANGDRVVLIADAATIHCYESEINQYTYASANNFATATSGLLAATGVGGAISNIVTWPRNISGSALAELTKVINENP